jgi:hypothetical protein
MEDIDELREQSCEYDEDRDECDPTAYTMVWQRVSVLKVTPKRVYTEPYQSPQLWGYDEARPWFDRQTLLEQGHAVWHNRRPVAITSTKRSSQKRERLITMHEPQSSTD